MWRGTGIRDDFFVVMLLIQCFWNKYFVVDYIFCYVFFRLFFRLFIIVSIFLSVIVHISIIVFVLLIFLIFVPWFFFTDSLLKVFLDMSMFVAVMISLYVHTFFMTALFFTYAHISRKSCRYTCIGFLFELGFHIFFRFLFLIVRSFGQILPKACHRPSQ